jgi:transcriptional regulator with XRE-family HTH domain
MLRSRDMSGARRGRPPNPVDPGASHAARLGAEIRAWRLARDLTLQQLGDLAGYTPQYVSEIERAKALPTRPFVAACDAALEADGALLALLPAVIQERTEERQERAAARRAARDGAPLPCEAHSDAGEDVDPTNRRGLIGAAGTAALGLSTAAAPAAAREIDPGLPDHWDALLDLLGCHDAAFGPHRVLEAVRNELRVIAEHRQVARGELRTQLMRAEARWASFAAWLSHDAGDLRRRDAWTDRAAWLALEAGYPDMQAFTRSRQSRFAAQAHDAPRTGAFAEAGLRVKGTSAQTRALCSAWSALGHAWPVTRWPASAA